MTSRKKRGQTDPANDKAKDKPPVDKGRSIQPGKPLVRARSSGSSNRPLFPVVGIGASAGGLEALKAFFERMTPQTGMAFVVVQHLDVSHKSVLADILQQSTQMRVQQATDGQKLMLDNVYVIPPRFDLAVMHGVLHLFPPPESPGLRLPIDFFLRSLAEDSGEQAIAIIFSGAGSDGSLGVKAVKGRGGMVMVQDPETARFDSMPQSAIATGVADVILAPNLMPSQLMAFVERALIPEIKGTGSRLLEPIEALQKIFVLLRDQTGHDFTQYKKNTIGRRIERRMVLNHAATITEYVHFLQKSPIEVETLFRDMLIGVTAFFRDPEAFEVLEQRVIPELFKGRSKNQPIRVWVPGSASGEEAYSIGILLREQMDARGQEFDVQIFATDIDERAIEEARMGAYPSNIALDVSPERLERFFTHEHQRYRVNKNIRDMIVFAQQSIIKDPPFSRLDLISCRNLLIYLEPELQKKVIPLFHYALKPGAFLFLGTSETLGSYSQLFEVVDRKQKIFRALPGEGGFRVTLGMTSHSRGDSANRGGEVVAGDKATMRGLMERVLLESYAPASVIIDDQYAALYFHRQTGKYLEPASGEANLNILSMAREGLRLPLTIAIRKVIATRQETRVDNIQVRVNGGYETINLIVRPVDMSGARPGLMLVVFEPTQPTTPAASPQVVDDGDERDRRIAELDQELRSTREYLQTTSEEWQASNEELKSVNEELQSANEELQSTMEEMETAKEELQSVNEELATVNTELEGKIDELTQSNNDLDNLLSNVKVGIIFLDRNLHIQRFTPSATELVNLIPGDVGRPFEHVVTNIVGVDLLERVRVVLDTLEYEEDEVETRSGKWYWMGVGPYRVHDRAVEGVVITFTEITDQKRAQQDLGEFAQRMAGHAGSQRVYQQLSGLLSALTTWYRVLNTAASERAIYQEICRIILSSGRYRLVWVGTRTERKDIRLSPVAFAGDDEGYMQLVGQQTESDELVEGTDVRALRTGEVSISQDISSDETYGPLREAAVEHGLLSTAALPLKDGQKVFGALNVYASQPNAFDTQEIEWLTVLTNNLIESLRKFSRPTSDNP